MSLGLILQTVTAASSQKASTLDSIKEQKLASEN